MEAELLSVFMTGFILVVALMCGFYVLQAVARELRARRLERQHRNRYIVWR